MLFCIRQAKILYKKAKYFTDIAIFAETRQQRGQYQTNTFFFTFFHKTLDLEHTTWSMLEADKVKNTRSE